VSGDFRWQSTSPDHTFAFGRVLGRHLCGGDALALLGELGSGKTQLVKGLAAGLGVAADEPVVSPTFVLVREYIGRLRLYHLDAYRLGGADDLLSLGIDEMLADSAGVVAVEWADRVPGVLPPTAWTVELNHAGEQRRELTVSVPDSQRRAAVQRDLEALRGSGGPNGVSSATDSQGDRS
jgi:tRNA threonylcarbamoyladenosine biosynthesis protein TsaE